MDRLVFGRSAMECSASPRSFGIGGTDSQGTAAAELPGGLEGSKSAAGTLRTPKEAPPQKTSAPFLEGGLFVRPEVAAPTTSSKEPRTRTSALALTNNQQPSHCHTGRPKPQRSRVAVVDRVEAEVGKRPPYVTAPPSHRRTVAPSHRRTGAPSHRPLRQRTTNPESPVTGCRVARELTIVPVFLNEAIGKDDRRAESVSVCN